VGIFRNGTFFLASSNTHGGGTVTAFNFGMTGDVPVTGGWNEYGVTEVGIFRNGVVYLASNNISGGGTVTAFTYGMTGDEPVAGKWT
jgi:L-serine deaminase